MDNSANECSVVDHGILQSAKVKQIVLSKLLDSVKQCQSEFGAKNLLATAESSKVQFLLLQLESILMHGLKKKAGFLSDVTSLMSMVLPIDNTATTIWLLLRRVVLSDQEIEVYAKLNHLTNDVSRIRSWLRMLLNEKSLRRNFDSLVSSDSLSDYYEDTAFLRDAEMMSAFCQMATGLQTILFALKTNDAELTEPSSLNSEDVLVDVSSGTLSHQNKVPQPIMNVSARSSGSYQQKLNNESPQKNDDKTTTKLSRRPKKPLVNFVSFDSQKNLSDNACQMRVVLAPRSASLSAYSASVADTNSVITEPQIDEQILYIGKAESVISDTSAATTSGGGGNVFEPADSPCLSESEPESSSVCSADAIESTSKTDVAHSSKESNKNITYLTNQIEILQRELQNIRFEHSKFIRLHGLKFDNLKIQCENSMKSIERRFLSTTPHPNSHLAPSGASSVELDDQNLMELYQKRLSQLSQMHSELLELNDYLLKENRFKNRMNERLKLELISLRGPLPEDLLVECPALKDTDEINKLECRTLINIWIPTAFLSGKGTDVHYVYQVYVRLTESEWNVYRRYSEFLSLHNKLCKRDSFLKSNFIFPPKKKFGSKKKPFVDARRRELEQYLRLVINYVVQHFPEFNSLAVSKETLSHLMPFFRA